MWRISHYAEESGFSITLMSRRRRKLLDAVMFACSKTYELSVFPCNFTPLHVIPLYMSLWYCGHNSCVEPHADWASSFSAILCKAVTLHAALWSDVSVRFGPMLTMKRFMSLFTCSLKRSHGMFLPSPPRTLIHKTIPHYLVIQVRRQGGIDLHLDPECFERVLCTAKPLEVRHEELPAANHPLTITFSPCITKFHNECFIVAK